VLHFNEGTPGAGKSYDAVLRHILPALSAGRRVFARLNGLNPEAIAAYLCRPRTWVYMLLHRLIPRHFPVFEPRTADEVRELLTVLDDNDVHNLANVVTRDALVVIDEAHMYWVASREPLAPETEKLFAEHRHLGLDIVLISQWYKRLHSAVRARVESKAVFTKLQAVGMKGWYERRFYTVIEPDKFEKVGGTSHPYRKEIFALYQSVQAGTENLEVYSAGALSVWRKPFLLALFVVPAGLYGAYHLLQFFTGGVQLVEQKETVNAPTREVAAPQAGFAPGSAAPVLPAAITAPAPPPKPAGVAYVWKLTAEGRPRVAGTFEGTKRLAIIEWRTPQGHIQERLTTLELAELGVRSSWTRYGVKLTWKDEAIIVTAHPTGEEFGRVSDARLAQMRPAYSPAPASLASSGRGIAPPPRTNSAPRVGGNFTGVESGLSGGGAR
jgi:zona occludens toxin